MQYNTLVSIVVVLVLAVVSARVNRTEEFSSYLKENTTLHHYNDQFINAV
jgi:hypothetical protein